MLLLKSKLQRVREKVNHDDGVDDDCDCDDENGRDVLSLLSETVCAVTKEV